MMWMFVLVVRGSCCGIQSLWSTVNIVLVCVSSLAAILAQWMASRVVLWSGGNAMPIPSHLEDCALPKEPNSMSRLWRVI